MRSQTAKEPGMGRAFARGREGRAQHFCESATRGGRATMQSGDSRLTGLMRWICWVRLLLLSWLPAGGHSALLTTNASVFLNRFYSIYVFMYF